MMYSQITSMLYLSWAEIGMIGAPSATVPVCACACDGVMVCVCAHVHVMV